MLAQTESKLKEVSEQSSKIQRSYQSMAGQVDKYKHTSEIFKHKCEGLETQLVSIRKVQYMVNCQDSWPCMPHGVLK